MELDLSASEQFLSYLDGDCSLSEIWGHPAYDAARDHAELFGRELTEGAVERALAGEQTAFTRGTNPVENREKIANLLGYVREREDEWTTEIAHNLRRVTHEEDLSDVVVYLGIGYELGIGLEKGAYLDLNEPLFFESPRQLLYTAIHESSHVVYEQEHRARGELDLKPDLLAEQELQWDVFNTVFHTEAYATYTPLALRREDGNVGEADHLVCADYRALSDDTQLRALVERYDSLRDTLQDSSVSRETLLTTLFGEHRLPYRLGCAMLDCIEREEGIEEVRDAFYCSPNEFCETYDWALATFRSS